MTEEITRLQTTVAGIERYCIPRQIIAECDKCREQYLGGDVWNSKFENEALLLKDGWLIIDDVHICPLCRHD